LPGEQTNSKSVSSIEGEQYSAEDHIASSSPARESTLIGQKVNEVTAHLADIIESLQDLIKFQRKLDYLS
jgi:hypothetical protein